MGSSWFHLLSHFFSLSFHLTATHDLSMIYYSAETCLQSRRSCRSQTLSFLFFCAFTSKKKTTVIIFSFHPSSFFFSHIKRVSENRETEWERNRETAHSIITKIRIKYKFFFKLFSPLFTFVLLLWLFIHLFISLSRSFDSFLFFRICFHCPIAFISLAAEERDEK